MFNKKNKTTNTFAKIDTLFGDLPLDYWAGIDTNESPWDLFKAVKKSIDKKNHPAAIELLEKIISIPGLESRQYLQAWYFLNELGGTSKDDIILYGVVVEVAMEDG